MTGDAGLSGPNVTSTVEPGHRSERESARSLRTEVWTAKAVLKDLWNAKEEQNAQVLWPKVKPRYLIEISDKQIFFFIKNIQPIFIFIYILFCFYKYGLWSIFWVSINIDIT